MYLWVKTSVVGQGATTVAGARISNLNGERKVACL